MLHETQHYRDGSRGTTVNDVANQVFPIWADQGWIPVSDWRFDDSRPQPVAPASRTGKAAAWMDKLPTMAATVLGLDLLLQARGLDLRAASELILSDVGATVHVLRLTSNAYQFNPERPIHIEDCLAHLDVGTWFGTISAQTAFRRWNYTRVNAVWQHCRIVAQYARLIAESLEDVSPDEAYLVGLLHEIDTLPGLVHPQLVKPAPTGPSVDQIIPAFVLDALHSAKERGSSSVWRYILSSAHALAAATPRMGTEEENQRAENKAVPHAGYF